MWTREDHFTIQAALIISMELHKLSCSVLLIVAWNGTRSLGSKAVSTLSCVQAPSIWTVGSNLDLVISGANFPSDVAFLAKLSTELKDDI